MQRRLIVIVATAVLLLGGAVLLLARPTEQPSKPAPRHEPGARQFVGYWMGIDPLDGGDSRRGITRNPDRTFSVIGRDTVFTLCDDTDRAIVTVDAAALAGRALVSDDFVITCTRDDSIVRLTVRYDVIDRNVVRETVRRPNGELVDRIIFHRVSAP